MKFRLACTVFKFWSQILANLEIHLLWTGS